MKSKLDSESMDNTTSEDSQTKTVEFDQTEDTERPQMRRWSVNLRVTTTKMRNGWFSKRVLEDVETKEVEVYATDAEDAEDAAKHKIRTKMDNVKIKSVEVISCHQLNDTYIVTATAYYECNISYDVQIK